MTSIPRPVAPNPDWANFTSDEWDNFTPDQWSNLEVTNEFTATYDAWNRLIKLTDPTGTVQVNEYDARNFRIIKTEYTKQRCQEPLISVYGYFSSNYCSFESQLIDFLGEITK